MKPISSYRGVGFFVCELIMHQGEHRKYRRASMMGRVQIMHSWSPLITEAYATNVSQGGMGLYSPRPIALNSEVVLKIFYMDATGEKASELISGVVRWCRPIGSWFGVGIEFKHLNPKEHSMLLSFLEQTEQTKRS